MKPRTMWISAAVIVGVALAVGIAGLTLSLGVRPPGPGPYAGSSCLPSPSLSGVTVPAQQFTSIGEDIQNDSAPNGGPPPLSRLSLWSESGSTYYLYVMNQAQFGQLGWTSNASGPSHSTHAGPATDYLWGSGPVTHADQTVLIGNGIWTTVLYDPSPANITVDHASANCNFPP